MEAVGKKKAAEYLALGRQRAISFYFSHSLHTLIEISNAEPWGEKKKETKL